TLIVAIARNSLLFWGLIIAQFGIVLVLSGRVQTLAASTASALFIAYSALTGVTMSFVLLVFTDEAISSPFVHSAGMFCALARAGWGSLNRSRLAGWGQCLFMGLVGVVRASFVGIFWQNDALQFATAFVGVVVFTGLTAYDAQRLKAMALAMPDGQTGSYAIV